MAIPIMIPRLGWNMEEGVFGGWLKPDGATIRAGDALFSLESDKATEDIECLDDGILRIPPHAPEAGDTVEVGAVIGYLVKAGEAPPFQSQASPPAAADLTLHETVSHPNAISATSIPLMRVAAATQNKRAISPRAKRIASELGVDWTRLSGSGRNGRIRERDVRAAATSQSTTLLGHDSASVAVTSIRRTIAERMLNSHRSTAPVTLTTTADATNLVGLRNQFKAAAQVESDVIPSYTDFLVKLTALALEKHPLLNACWSDEQIRLLPVIHIGVAVDTEAGLLVPVIRDVLSLSLKQIAARSHDLVKRARQRRLKLEEMQGGTFTITSLGEFGIDAFSPLIHFPQCAVLGVGRIQRRPVDIADRVEIRDQITLSLTFDHRIVDGAPAARFLQALTLLIENPGPWLMT
jgi:pyruvate dehydrogenase E2 component (dihydrolipoamide acetyltransferase)